MYGASSKAPPTPPPPFFLGGGSFTIHFVDVVWKEELALYERLTMADASSV